MRCYGHLSEDFAGRQNHQFGSTHRQNFGRGRIRLHYPASGHSSEVDSPWMGIPLDLGHSHAQLDSVPVREIDGSGNQTLVQTNEVLLVASLVPAHRIEGNHSQEKLGQNLV